MDAPGLRALNAITLSSLHLLHFSSRPPLLPRRPFFSLQSTSKSLCLPSTRFLPLSSFSERCRADALATAEASSNKEFLQVVLVSPQVDDAKLKRAGLDYWPYVVVKVHNSWSDFREYFKKKDGEKRLLAFTKLGTNIHSEFIFRKGDWLVFGSETSGLPPEALVDCKSESLGFASR